MTPFGVLLGTAPDPKDRSDTDLTMSYIDTYSSYFIQFYPSYPAGPVRTNATQQMGKNNNLIIMFCIQSNQRLQRDVYPAQRVMESLPMDILIIMFSLLTSKERADSCSVSSKWYDWLLLVSKMLSPTPEIYDYGPWRRIPKKLRIMISMDDYHLIVRRKRLQLISVGKICRENSIDTFRITQWNPKEYLCDHDWGLGLIIACKLGHNELIDEILCGQLYNINEETLERATKKACSGGHIEILKQIVYIMNKNTNPTFMLYNVMATMMRVAGKKNHREIIDWILSICDGDHTPYLATMCLYGACRGGHLDLVEMFIDKAEGSCFPIACSNNHIDIMKFMIDRGVQINCYCGRSLAAHV